MGDMKPLSLRRADCLAGLVEAINSAQLPAFVIVDLLDGLLREAKALANSEYKRDLEAYQAQQNDQSTEQEA